MKNQLTWIKRMLSMNGPEASEEDNADVLLRMAEDGDDLTKPREIDFHHLFTNVTDAVSFLAAVREQGFSNVDHDFWHERSVWLTSVHVSMVPVLAEITATEITLNEIAVSFDGEPDGWGCMEVI